MLPGIGESLDPLLTCSPSLNSAEMAGHTDNFWSRSRINLNSFPVAPANSPFASMKGPSPPTRPGTRTRTCRGYNPSMLVRIQRLWL